MWRNYLTVAWRTLAKNRTYAAINIAGLAIGLAACLLILLFVRDQLSYDSFVADVDHVYQVQTHITDPDTDAHYLMQATAIATSRAMARSLPEVAEQAFIYNDQSIVIGRDGQSRGNTITVAEPGFFDIYDIPFTRGSGRAALAAPGTVAISEGTATRLFGTTQALGRDLIVLTPAGRQPYRVAGVFRDLPKTSHQRFSIVRRLNEQDIVPGQDRSWAWFNGYSYLKLRPGTNVAAFNASLDAWAKRTAPYDIVGGQRISQVANFTMRLRPVREVHLSGAVNGPAGQGGDATTIATFALLAVVILGMACINFTNLATARASSRAREVALRKVLGATRGQLVTQFLVESVVVTAVAMLLALALAELALPFLRRFLDAALDYSYFGADGMLLPALWLVLAVGIAGGLYPALFLTRVLPASVLKANKSAAETPGSGRLRNALVVGQFAVSIGLIVCTAVVWAQTDYVRRADLGFQRDHLLQIDGVGNGLVAGSSERLLGEIRRVPGVRSATKAMMAVDAHNRSNNTALLPGRTTPLGLGTTAIDWGFVQTAGMRIVAGRDLSQAHALDDATVPWQRDDTAERALAARGINVLVNEASAKQMGFPTSASAVGKQFRIDLVNTENGPVPATIVGVVADTRFRSLHERVEDLVFYRNRDAAQYIVVRTDGVASPAAMRARIEAAWKHVLPQVPFDADWADDVATNLYAQDDKVATLFAIFAGLAVAIGCLGLFGLAAFTAERRTKEIGIRKVLGARTSDIVRLLVWQFCRPVLLANLLAWPAAWWAMRSWLNGFDVRVALTPLPFLLAGGLALAIAVLTVGGHAGAVARALPIRALRYE